MLMSIFEMEKEQRLLIIAMLWQWWTARNKKNANDGNRTVEDVVFQSRRWAMEFSEFYANKPAKNSDITREEKWSSPDDAQTLKLNVDGSFTESISNRRAITRAR
jgi:hypothetical protein